MKILVIAAHPDDEVLGMGATIKKFTKKGHQVNLCVISEGSTAQYKNKKMIKIRRESCKKSGKILGLLNIEFLDYPDMRLDSILHLHINKKLEKIIKKFKPDTVYTTPPNDLNRDHQEVFESTLVATRPLSSSVKNVLCYELPGISRLPFNPNVYENVINEFSFKIKALKVYKSEVKEFPHSRSIKSIESLSVLRGVEAGLKKAEAFHLFKKISN